MLHLEGKVGLVTGGASGIGEATVRRLCAEGARVVIADWNEQRGTELAAELLAQGSDVLFHRVDVASEGGVRGLVQRAIEEFGGLELAVNNAGFGHAPGRVHELTAETWDGVHGVNTRGVWLCLKYEIAQMILAGGGSIVNTASVAGLKGLAGMAAYSASKHALIGLTRTAAIDYVGDRVRINAVAPGTVATPLMRSLPQEVQDSFASLMPVGRIARPEEVASVIVWLLSEQANYVSGEVVTIDHASLQT